jgi:hypothetical protein
MNSKIKVDPRTFKIINQEKSIESKKESDTLSSDSDSDSLTSVNSDADTDSIKVIKLDNSLQNGGKNEYMKQPLPQQPQQPIQVKKFEESPKTSFNSSFNSSAININNNTPPVSQPKSEQNRMEERYLRTSQLSDNSIESSISESSIEETKEDEEEKEEIANKNPEVEKNSSSDVIDLTKSQLHDVLYSIFTDVAGNNISENIEKMSKLFEAHNQIMEKILNQLIIMNSNYKQVTVPEAIQTNTKQAKSLNDFRKNTEKINNEN